MSDMNAGRSQGSLALLLFVWESTTMFDDFFTNYVYEQHDMIVADLGYLIHGWLSLKRKCLLLAVTSSLFLSVHAILSVITGLTRSLQPVFSS